MEKLSYIIHCNIGTNGLMFLFDIKEQDSDKYVDEMKSELDNIWKEFILHAEKHPDICDKGIINEKRLPSPRNEDEEAKRKTKIEAFIESLEVKDITEILLSVHEKTGFLNSFKIVNQSYHGNSLSDEERKKVSMITVLARGMNIGLEHYLDWILEQGSGQ